MKNVFYINCQSNPWIKVAQHLQKTEQLKPVYWNGYPFMDKSDKLVPEAFPDIIYSEDSKSWRGIFPDKIAEKAATTCIDVDFLRKYASEELQAIKMMDRIDYDQYSLNFQERERIYRNMVRGWMAAIELLSPNMVISATIPHHVSDFVLYLLCKHYGIPYIMPERTSFLGRFIINDDPYTIGDKLDAVFKEKLQEEDEVLLKSLPKDISDRYLKLQEDYSKGAPYFMQLENKTSKRLAHFWGLADQFFRYFKDNDAHQPLFGEKGLLTHGVIVYYKNNKEWIENAHFSLVKYCYMHIVSGRFKKKMLNYYKSLTVKPDYSEPYVLFGLHYQPEATSNPAGDIFVDQRLAIDLLLKNLPDDYKIYVKEHPHQYLKQREGHTCRIKEFYDDLKKNPRIRLLDINESTFKLIQHAKAVATIKGTIGFESAVYKKPVIQFGCSWYEKYPGVLKVTDEGSAQGIYSFIKDYKFDQHALLAYLAATAEKSYLAYFFLNYMKGSLTMTEDECAAIWTEAISTYLHRNEKR